MKIFTTILLGMSLAFVGGAGCKKGGGAAELAPAEALATKACACTTAECLTAVKGEFRAFENTLEAKYKGKEPPKSLEQAWEKIEDKAKACADALKAKLGASAGSAAAPPADPAGSAAAPAAPAAPAAEPAPAAGSGSAQ